MKLIRKMLTTALLFMVIALSFPYSASAGGSGYVLIEASDNRVIYESNAHQKLPMASTTKVMTAIIAIENAPLEMIVTVPEICTRVEGSSMYLRAGDRLSIRDLLYGLMLSSGNDAALTLAYTIAGSVENFTVLMNEKARQLGANDTHFQNPHGLHDNAHYTTAYDLALICSYAMKNEIFAEIVSTVDKRVNFVDSEEYRMLHNKNKLLATYNGANGIKIGFTKAAGRCLCASAKRNDRQLICVILNDGNWFNTAAGLFDRAFRD